jgi:hypothetical protein
VRSMRPPLLLLLLPPPLLLLGMGGELESPRR